MPRPAPLIVTCRLRHVTMRAADFFTLLTLLPCLLELSVPETVYHILSWCTILDHEKSHSQSLSPTLQSFRLIMV